MIFFVPFCTNYISNHYVIISGKYISTMAHMSTIIREKVTMVVSLLLSLPRLCCLSLLRGYADDYSYVFNKKCHCNSFLLIFLRS